MATDKVRQRESEQPVPKIPPPEIEQPTEETLTTSLIKKVKALYEERQIDQLMLFDEIHGGAYLKVEKLIEGIEKPEEKEIDVVLHSSGGSPEYAYRIIKMLRERFKAVNIIIPF